MRFRTVDAVTTLRGVVKDPTTMLVDLDTGYLIETNFSTNSE